jgi:hypothetical protein
MAHRGAVIAARDAIIPKSSQKSAICNLSVMVVQRSIRYIWHRKMALRC